jgi:hypothetical protein
MSTAPEFLGPSVRRWLDGRFRTTTRQTDAVYEESLNGDGSEVKLRVDVLDHEISRVFPAGIEENGHSVAWHDLNGSSVTLLGDYDDRTELEWKLEGERFRLRCDGGIWSGRNDARTLNIRAVKRCPERDCQEVIGQYMRLRRQEEDIALLAGLNLEFGVPHEIPADKSTIARCHPEAASIWFYLHSTTGRLWVTAINTVTKPIPNADANTRSLNREFCSVTNYLQHECGRIFLTLDPEAQNIQGAVAFSLGKLRENGTVSRRDAESLMLLGQSLNPHYTPAVVAEWLDYVRRDGDHTPSSRNNPADKGLLAGDRKLAAELCSEAFFALRWSGGQLPPVLDEFQPATPIKCLVSIPLESPQWVAGPSETHTVHRLPPDKTAAIWDYVPLCDRLKSASQQVKRC